MEADDHDPTDASPSARGRVRDGLRKQILSGALKPGTRLTQQRLAKEFGVAQSVVRESLLELQFAGLVRSVERVGIFVSELDAGQLLEAYEVRAVLEGLAARDCCQRASRGDLNELRGLADKVHELGVAGDAGSRGAHDRRFHRRMIEISGNAILIRLTESYQELGMVVHASRPHDVIHQEHLGILDAIVRDDPEAAERLARAHVIGARDAIAGQLARKEFVPRWVEG